MTKIQFDTIRRLARAYGHEWALNLDFEQKFPTMTRGDWMRYMAAPIRHRNGEEYVLTDPAELAEVELFQKWVALHARIEAGHVPTFDEIESLAVPLFESEHFPSTPWILLKHETCTHRTRWEVRADGSVRFEFLNGHVAPYEEGPKLPHDTLLATAEVLPDRRVSITMDLNPDLEEWLAWHHDRIVGACVAVGVAEQAVDMALSAASKSVRIQLSSIRRQREAQAARDSRAKSGPPTTRIVGGTRRRRNARRRLSQ